MIHPATMKIVLFSLPLLGLALPGHAEDSCYATGLARYLTEEELLPELLHCDLVILGENHDNAAHHAHQAAITGALADRGRLTLGLEFISWSFQEDFRAYQAGTLPEEEFLKKVQWGTTPFSFYRPLVVNAVRSGSRACGINAPSWLTRKISRQGLSSLTPEELALLPSDFTLGSTRYLERFKAAMAGMGHVPEDKIKNYFAAQSAWDETMASCSLGLQQQDRNLFVIIVGNFHAEYKLGLPARILARAAPGFRLATVVQVDARSLTPEEIQKLIDPDPAYGVLGDFIIFTRK